MIRHSASFIAFVLASCSGPQEDPTPSRQIVEFQLQSIVDPIVARALIDGRRALVDSEGLDLEPQRAVVQSGYDNLLSSWRSGYRTKRRSGWDQSQGALIRTDRDLDIAVDGIGFLAFLAPDATVVYTRNGSLQIDGQGNLLLEGQVLRTPVTVPENVTRVFIDTTGLIQGFDPSNVATLQTLGKLTIVRFINPEGLASDDGVFFRETVESGKPILGEPAQNGFGLIRQGFIEESNVKPLKEALNLVADVRRLELMIALKMRGPKTKD